MPNSYRQALTDYMSQEARPIEKYGHQPRLYALATQIGADLDHDDDVLFAAAWLHDLGVFTGHRPEDPDALGRWDHVAYVIEKAPDILRKTAFPDKKIANVLEAIRTHQPKDNPTTIEGVILRDADILEQLGAIGVLRTVCKVGRDTRFSTFTDAVDTLGRALAKLPAEIRLPVTQKLAQPRIETLRAFLDAVQRESAGQLH